ncbi:hypothetical protein Cpap_1436 [Ruminiclostridium papyrosolvens DSM 2782]|uniref:Uncharacterized protein n=1 Tax=Ruminiclostridium papyrosolvens DSM 2782 TaxID=588581 RepID=F1TFH2_9FIRM|nr:hypothetical protein [Ruminiclostridium papyrosolvens]EGD46896.1 hypothetical protein Cpap_1436 [Ruminiclostridium papyrosolvens DSM 2782]WES34378.1 hypothetical protein P0092_21935 [Ruminiclostridium papyrosolvens DSM 2782]
MELQNNVINAENLNEDNTLSVVQDKLKPGETVILDVGYNYFHQVDKLYELLVNEGYYVRKTFINGRNQLLVAQKDEKHQMY